MIIKINTENEAFQDGNSNSELGRILHGLAECIENGMMLPNTLRDINGNKVGTVDYTETEI